MKLKSLKTFEVLNKEAVTVISGGKSGIAYDCSKKRDVDSEHHDFASGELTQL